MSTKQDKFYDTLRQTQANTFSDGLNMDLHPLTTPNTILTDCINGTMITYNDNEFVLQNERGNSKIDNANLSPGFIPVGMKEHNGILYIVSHNPQTKKTEIGTFPSPKQIVNSNLSTFNGNKNFETVSYYTEYKKDIVWYDYNLSVSNYDKYKITIDNPHPLIVLEHFILDKQGNIAKITLNKDKEYRFTHIGEGVLGYKYRPYFLSSISTNIDPVKGAKSAQIVVTITSDDEELWKEINYSDPESGDSEIRRKIEEFIIDYDITITLLSDTNELEIKDSNTIVNNINTYDWDYTYNLTRTDVINLKSLDSFTLDGTEYKYDFREGVVIKMEGDTPSNEKYNKIKFIITPKIQKDTGTDTYTVYMDHLKTELISDVSNVFSQESWFSKFQYQIANESEGIQQNSADDDVLLNFNITLDLTKYDVKWNDYEEDDIKDASYKLSEIDDNGNLIGLSIPIRKSPKFDGFYPVVDSKTETVPTITGFKGLIIENDLLNYKNRTGEIKVLNLKPVNAEQCRNWSTIGISPKYVKYVRENDETYNVELYDADKKFLSKENIYSTLFGGESCSNDMEENFEEDHVKYIAKNVKLKKDKIYLFEFTFPIFNHTESILKQEKASFIVVTADYMLNLKEIPDRMDEIQLSKWFKSSYAIYEILIEDPEYITRSFTGKYKNHTINLEEIISKPDDTAVKNYAKKFFLKYNSLFDAPDNNMVPSISQRINGAFTFKNTSAFNCLLNLRNTIPVDKHDQIALIKNGYNVINSGGTIQMKNDFVKKISLTGTAKEYKQTVERKYLWDLFKNDEWEIPLKSSSAYDSVGYLDNEEIIKLDSPYGYYMTYLRGANNDWLQDTLFGSTYCYSIWRRKGNCHQHTSGYGEKVYVTYSDKNHNSFIDKNNVAFNVTSQLMHTNGLKTGMNFSTIKELDNYVKYNQFTKEKIWIHCKLENIYSLMGIDAIGNSTDSKSAYNAILRHAYYLNDVNKTVYQYTYNDEDIINDANEKIGSQIKISEESPTISKIVGSIFPAQCIFINKDYSTYNIQSFNNLNYNNLQNVNSSIFIDENPVVFEKFDEKYIIFLRELGNCLNNFPIPEEVLQQYNNSSLYFDYDSDSFNNNESYNLFNREIENKDDTNFYKPLKFISKPHLKYDKKNKILYTDKIEDDQINQFEYAGRDCVVPLKWNYSLTFDQFWNVSIESIDDLNKYHSLLFYRYSSYADE